MRNKQTCWNPYAGLNHPMAPYHYQHQRHYEKPGQYNAAADINQTTRTVVAGAVTIGAIGMLGGLMGGMMK